MAGSDVGAALGVRLAALMARSREASAAATTPGIVATATRIADSMAAERAERARVTLVTWLQGKGVTVPEDGELSGLLGFLTKAGGWLAQNVIGTAIGFGVGQSLSAVLNPYFTDLVQSAWRSHPNAVLTPEQLAVAVLKGHLRQGEAAEEAKASGIDAERFQTMVDVAGLPPGVEALLMLWRRGALSDADLERAVRQSNIRAEWLETIKDLGVQWPTWATFLDAYLMGQATEGEARELYGRAGGDPELFDLMYATRGQAPTPVQALELLNRGIIPERGTGIDATSYEQAFLEGPWRNKWLEPFLALRTYIVPPRSVVPMVRSGAWTAERGIEELAKSGVPSDVAAAMVTEASNDATAEDRELTKAEVLALFGGQFLDRAEAQQLLELIGYGPDQVAMLLDLTETKRLRAFRDRLVATVRAKYVSRKIEELDVVTALDGLGVPNDARDQYLDLWTQERAATTADLTLAQWQAAVKRGLVSMEDFGAEMTRRGYSDAEVAILVGLTTPTPTGG